MKWDLRRIMLRAWAIYRKGEVSFGEALHRAWEAAKAEPVNARRIEDAKAAAGITEQTETWSGWRKLGYEVCHGERALFQADLIHATKGDGKIYRASFFGMSQVAAIPA